MLRNSAPKATPARTRTMTRFAIACFRRCGMRFTRFALMSKVCAHSRLTDASRDIVLALTDICEIGHPCIFHALSEHCHWPQGTCPHLHDESLRQEVYALHNRPAWDLVVPLPYPRCRVATPVLVANVWDTVVPLEIPGEPLTKVSTEFSLFSYVSPGMYDALQAPSSQDFSRRVYSPDIVSRCVRQYSTSTHT